MDAESFEKDLNAVGKSIRAYYTKIGKGSVRPDLQIDSAGGHGMARGEAVFKRLKAMMLSKYNINLIQQPGNSPFFNILDLTIWQASQVEVDKMNSAERQREAALVEVCKKAWKAVSPVKILQAFEMRRDCAQEALETNGWCNHEGKGRGGSKRVHEGDSYAPLRKLLKIDKK